MTAVREKSPPLLVSVVVPVWRDEEIIHCLRRLDGQSFPKSCFEVVVVNNEPLRPLRLDSRFDMNLRVVVEEKRGSYAARNRGISEATGRILAFTDSDCLPHRDWLAEGVRTIEENPICGFAAGRIEVLNRSKQRTLFLYDTLIYFNQAQWMNRSRCAATANLFVRAEVFRSIGRFDDRLVTLGDMEWTQRAHEAGLLQVYAPKAVVSHPSIGNLPQFFRRARRLAGGWRELNQDRRLPEAARRTGGYIKLIRFYWEVSRHEMLSGTLERIAFLNLVLSEIVVGILEKIRIVFGGVVRRH